MSESSTESTDPGPSSDLRTGSIPKALLSMAGPMLIGLVSMNSMAVVDTYFVGQLGATPLAAMSFSFPIMFFAIGLVSGIAAAVQSVVSRAVGDDDHGRARRTTTLALCIALAAIALLIFAVSANYTPIFSRLGAEMETLPYIEEYLSIWFVSLVLFVTPVIGGAALMASGNARAPMLFMVGAALLNAIFDPILIFGFGGIPAMGLEGAALASTIARGVVTVATFVILARQNVLAETWQSLADAFGPTVSDILRLGVPAVGRNILPPVTMGILTRLVSQFGEPAVAAYGAGTRLQSLILVVHGAVGMGLVPVVGQNWGAELFDRVREALTFSQTVAVGWGLVMWGVLAFGAESVARVFVEDPVATDHFALYLFIAPAGFAPQGLFQLGNSTLNAIDRPMTAATLSVLRAFGLLIPLAWAGSEWFGLAGLFWGIVLAKLLIGIVGAMIPRHLIDAAAPHSDVASSKD